MTSNGGLFVSGLVYTVVEIRWLQQSYNDHCVEKFPRHSFAHASSRYDLKNYTELTVQERRSKCDKTTRLRFVCGQVPLYVISQLVMTCDSAAATVVAREQMTQSSKA